MKPLAVLSVASEMFPLVKTGGLADVTGALPCALAAEGIAVRTLIPGYPVVMGAISGARKVLVMNDLFGGEARLLSVRHAGLDLLVLDAPHLFDRAGNPYLGPDGSDWPDNAMRFAALGLVAANIGDGALRRYAPSIIHAHDWQAGLAPAYLHYRGGARPGTIMTVHNLAFSGKAPRELLAPLGLPPRAFAIDGVEFHGAISMLKAGLQFADWITTVSPTYAAEIHAEPAGMGFSGLLNVRDAVLSGILNGIDTGIWNPATDIQIASPFDRDTLSKRVANKLALQKRMGLPQDAAIPLLGAVTRLTWQKGMDLLLSCLPMLRESGAQLVLVGSGDAQLEASFTDWAARDPDWLGCEIGYDEALAHQVQAGADAILVPSRFEPCGLTQLCALRYGAVPIVARVGGLADTVIDANPAALAACVATGIQFNPGTVDMLAVALRRALALYREPTIWRSLQMNGMACDVSWHGAAKQYARLYRNLVAVRV